MAYRCQHCHKEVSNSATWGFTKCPHCGESLFTEEFTSTKELAQQQALLAQQQEERSNARFEAETQLKKLELEFQLAKHKEQQEFENMKNELSFYPEELKREAFEKGCKTIPEQVAYCRLEKQKEEKAKEIQKIWRDTAVKYKLVVAKDGEPEENPFMLAYLAREYYYEKEDKKAALILAKEQLKTKTSKWCRDMINFEYANSELNKITIGDEIPPKMESLLKDNISSYKDFLLDKKKNTPLLLILAFLGFVAFGILLGAMIDGMYLSVPGFSIFGLLVCGIYTIYFYLYKYKQEYENERTYLRTTNNRIATKNKEKMDDYERKLAENKENKKLITVLIKLARFFKPYYKHNLIKHLSDEQKKSLDASFFTEDEIDILESCDLECGVLVKCVDLETNEESKILLQGSLDHGDFSLHGEDKEDIKEFLESKDEDEYNILTEKELHYLANLGESNEENDSDDDFDESDILTEEELDYLANLDKKYIVAHEDKENDNSRVKVNNSNQVLQIKKYECGRCGYVHEGEEAPQKCPLCNSPVSAFDERENNI